MHPATIFTTPTTFSPARTPILCAILLAVLCLLGSPRSDAQPESPQTTNIHTDLPHQLVQTTSQRVLKILNAATPDTSQIPALTNQLITELEPIVDFDGIGQAVMGKYYSLAAEAQREQFLTIFKATLGRLYTKSLLQFAITDIRVAPHRPDAPFKGNIIMTATDAKGATYTLTYTMRRHKDTGEWKILNVILDGINLGVTYRNQFYSMADRFNGDLEQVIQSWSVELNG